MIVITMWPLGRNYYVAFRAQLLCTIWGQNHTIVNIRYYYTPFMSGQNREVWLINQSGLDSLVMALC